MRGFLAGAAAAVASAFILDVLFQGGRRKRATAERLFQRGRRRIGSGVTSLRIRAFAVGATVLVQTPGTARMGDGRVRRRSSASFGRQPLTTANKRTHHLTAGGDGGAQNSPVSPASICQARRLAETASQRQKFSEPLKEGRCTKHNWT